MNDVTESKNCCVSASLSSRNIFSRTENATAIIGALVTLAVRQGSRFKICIAGEKAGLWGDFADSGSIPVISSIYGCRREMSSLELRCTRQLDGPDMFCMERTAPL